MKEYEPYKDEKEFIDNYFYYNSELDNSPCEKEVEKH